MVELSLINNSPAYTWEEAKKKGIKSVLRYKNRVCKVCNGPFDIEQTGIFYKCGCHGKN
tara:strand:+ start:1954 stop:2130 length:177 start_codon:yes stop_codon:yes gene_type:complete